MPNLIVSWVRTYWKGALLSLSLMAVFTLLHVLGGGQVRELTYALMLGGLLCLFALVVSLLSLHHRMKSLHQALLTLPEEASRLPAAQTPEAEMYQALAAAYLRSSREATRQQEARQRESQEYFTLWLHQMKTPLAALDLMAQSDGEVDKPLMRQELLKTRHYADMALTYQRLPSMRDDLELTEVALHPLCCACVRQLMPLFRYGGISLDMKPFAGKTLTDSKWLGFVITQVLTNALKYTPKGGSISIRLEAPCTLVIEDTGIGIRAEDVPRVFERGFTGLSGRVHEKSTGIGLYLCREIMRQLGHRIHLASEVGQGTRVSLALQRDKWEDMG